MITIIGGSGTTFGGPMIITGMQNLPLHCVPLGHFLLLPGHRILQTPLSHTIPGRHCLSDLHPIEITQIPGEANPFPL